MLFLVWRALTWTPASSYSLLIAAGLSSDSMTDWKLYLTYRYTTVTAYETLGFPLDTLLFQIPSLPLYFSRIRPRAFSTIWYPEPPVNSPDQ